MTKYPQIVFEITNGDSTKNITFNGVKATQDSSKVRTVGNNLETAQGSGWTYVKADLITSANVDTND